MARFVLTNREMAFKIAAWMRRREKFTGTRLKKYRAKRKKALRATMISRRANW